ncbi:ClpXP protease specificity-enhancing factor [Ignatzschineria sp. LJL83]
MTSNKPYFIRALYEWILDNNCTPYIVVDATLPFVEVPEQFISEGKIILNILPSATQHLDLGDDWVTFSARFSGIAQEINIPIGAIIAIYAQENGEGMGFETEALPLDYFEETILKVPSKTSSKKTHLDVIETVEAFEDNTEKSVVDTSNTTKKSSDKKGKKPTLTIIK